jgi:hypothetical protein
MTKPTLAHSSLFPDTKDCLISHFRLPRGCPNSQTSTVLSLTNLSIGKVGSHLERATRAGYKDHLQQNIFSTHLPESEIVPNGANYLDEVYCIFKKD